MPAISSDLFTVSHQETSGDGISVSLSPKNTHAADEFAGRLQREFFSYGTTFKAASVRIPNATPRAALTQPLQAEVQAHVTNPDAQYSSVTGWNDTKTVPVSPRLQAQVLNHIADRSLPTATQHISDPRFSSKVFQAGTATVRNGSVSVPLLPKNGQDAEVSRFASQVQRYDYYGTYTDFHSASVTVPSPTPTDPRPTLPDAKLTMISPVKPNGYIANTGLPHTSFAPLSPKLEAEVIRKAQNSLDNN